MSFYREKFLRNPLSKGHQAAIRRSVFAIVGLGGTGGFILENLLRMGAENFLLFDHDRFELSNFNRQMLATDDFLDMPKVHAAVIRAMAINKNINIKTFGHFDETSNLCSAAILLDGTDNIKAKLAMARLARKEKIPYIFSSAQGTRGIVTVFVGYRFEKAFQLPCGNKVLDRYAGTGCPGILCPAASLAGTLAASQAVNVIIGKPFIKAPEAIFFDIFRKKIFWKAKLG